MTISIRPLFVATFVALSGSLCFGENQLVMSQPALTSADGTTLVEIEIENTFTQPVKALRAMVILLDENGKVVGSSSQWLGGEKASKPLSFDAGETKTFPVAIRTKGVGIKTNVFLTQVILEDGTKPNPHEAFAIQKPK